MLALTLAPVVATAQQQRNPPQSAPATPATAPFSVGIVDISTILRRSTAAQAMQRQMQVEQEKHQMLADQQQRKFQAEEEAIERQRSSITVEAYTQKRKEFTERISQTTAEYRNRRRQIDEGFNEASSEINRTLLGVIEDLARERSIQLVVRREAVLYLEEGEDLTEAAAQALNQRLPEVTVTLPPPVP